MSRQRARSCAITPLPNFVAPSDDGGREREGESVVAAVKATTKKKTAGKVATVLKASVHGKSSHAKKSARYHGVHVPLLSQGTAHVLQAKQTELAETKTMAGELFQYSKVLATADPESSLAAATRKASELTMTMFELNESLARNMQKRFALPLEAAKQQMDELSSLEPMFIVCEDFAKAVKAYFRVGRQAYRQAVKDLLEFESIAASLPDSSPTYEEGDEVQLPPRDLAKVGQVTVSSALHEAKSFWMVVTWQWVLCYPKRKSNVIALVIPLPHSSVKDVQKTSFCIRTATNSFLIECETTEETRDWVENVSSCTPAATGHIMAERVPLRLVRTQRPQKGGSYVLPASVEAFLMSGMQEFFWRDLAAGNKELIEWVARPEHVAQLLKFALMTASLSAIQKQLLKVGRSSSEAITRESHESATKVTIVDKAAKEKERNSSPGPWLLGKKLSNPRLAFNKLKTDSKSSAKSMNLMLELQRLKLEYAELAINALSCHVSISAVVANDDDLLATVFHKLKADLPAAAVSHYCKVVDLLLRKHDQVVFDFLERSPQVATLLLSRVHNEQMFRLLVNFWNYGCSRPMVAVLNALGAHVLSTLPELEHSYEDETFTNYLVFLHTLVARQDLLTSSFSSLLPHQDSGIKMDADRILGADGQPDNRTASPVLSRRGTGAPPPRSHTPTPVVAPVKQGRHRRMSVSKGSGVASELASLAAVERKMSRSDIAFMSSSSSGLLTSVRGQFISLVNDKAVLTQLVTKALGSLNEKTASAMCAFLSALLSRVLARGSVDNSKLPSLLSALMRSTSAFKQVLAERRDTDNKLLPFSPRQLATVRLVGLMARSKSAKVLQRMADKKLLHSCWDAFFRHPLCSCLHAEVLRISEHLFLSPSCQPAATAFLSSYGLVSKLLDLLSSNKRKGARGCAHETLSNVAQAVIVCRWIAAFDDADLRETLAANERWLRYSKSMAFDQAPELKVTALGGTAQTLGLDDGSSNPHPEDFNFLLSLY